MRFASPMLVIFSLFVVVCGADTSAVFAQTSLNRLERALSDSPPQQQEPGPAGATEKSTPGYLGFVADSVPAADGGVTLTKIHPGSPAEKAGLKAGDVIKRVNDKPIETLQDMKRVAGLPPGSAVTMQIDRSGKSHDITATMGIRSATSEAVATLEYPPPKLGVTIVPITVSYQRTYQFTVGEGVFVKSVRPNSAAAGAGIPLHSVIVAVDGIGVRTPDDLIALVQGTRPGNPIVVAYVVGRRLYRKTVDIFPALAPAKPAVKPSTPAKNELKNQIETLEGKLQELRRQATENSAAPKAGEK